MKRLVLTDRDQALLHRLYDFGLMTTTQLRRSLFPSTSKSGALRRLRKLRKEKLIDHLSAFNQGERVWWITKKGGGRIGHPQGYGHVNKNTLEHDVMISEVRLHWEKCGIIEAWTPGHLLKKTHSQKERGEEPENIPDGIAILRTSSPKALAIEVEMSAKALSRYVDVLSRYQHKESLTGVWYITGNRQVEKSIQEAAARNSYYKRKVPWVFWSTLREALGDPRNLMMRNTGTPVHLKKIISDLKSPVHFPVHDVNKRDEKSKNEESSKSLEEKESEEKTDPLTSSPPELTIRGFKGGDPTEETNDKLA